MSQAYSAEIFQNSKIGGAHFQEIFKAVLVLHLHRYTENQHWKHIFN